MAGLRQLKAIIANYVVNASAGAVLPTLWRLVALAERSGALFELRSN
jgi:hypothetical protein